MELKLLFIKIIPQRKNSVKIKQKELASLENHYKKNSRKTRIFYYLVLTNNNTKYAYALTLNLENS